MKLCCHSGRAQIAPGAVPSLFRGASETLTLGSMSTDHDPWRPRLRPAPAAPPLLRRLRRRGVALSVLAAGGLVLSSLTPSSMAAPNPALSARPAAGLALVEAPPRPASPATAPLTAPLDKPVTAPLERRQGRARTRQEPIVISERGGNLGARVFSGGSKGNSGGSTGGTGGSTGGSGASAGGSGGGSSAAQRALSGAYPGAFRIEGNSVIFPGGTRIPWDDGDNKSPAQLLADADVEDMFHYPYPTGTAARTPGRDEDPGRIRNDAFFKALYGSDAATVRASLRSVPWVPRLGGGQLPVTTRFGVDKKLEAVSRELEQLPARFHKYLVPSAGTFNWRAIAGTRRQSVHSFGAAIDINTKYTNYWRWDAPKSGTSLPYRNQIPLEIVEIFEKYCFVWGGRWYHYDTMHFEYRPELLPNCH